MSHGPHELVQEFLATKDQIDSLTLPYLIESDAYFVKLSEEYFTANRKIQRIETQVTPADDEYEK